jgi:hypothetical protein
MHPLCRDTYTAFCSKYLEVSCPVSNQNEAYLPILTLFEF